MEQVLDLPLDKIEPNPGQPRTEFDQEALEELGRSIVATDGVMEPIVVRPNGNGGYQIVAGERRWRASKIAEMGTIRGIIRDVDDKQMALMSLVENVVRRDLNTAEQGEFLKKLLESGVGWDEICEVVGTERKYLEWKVVIVEKCVSQVVWMVKEGHMSNDVAWGLGKLSQAGQMRFLRTLNRQPMTYQEQLGLVNAMWAEENQAEMFEETKLTEEQVGAAQAFRACLDRAISAAVRLEKLEKANPGTLGLAMATEMDLSIEKMGQLQQRLGGLRRSLQQAKGRMARKEAA